MKNLCGEIALSESQVMGPQWQLALMDSLRQRAGLPVYTQDEAKKILQELESAHEDRFAEPSTGSQES